MDRAFTVHTEVALPAVMILTALAGFVILLPKVWPKARFGITYVHELGHSTASVMTGGGLKGIKIHGDSSGQAETWRRAGFIGWLASKITLWAGYPFPAFVALIMTLSAALGVSSGLLFVLTLIAGIAILFMRSLYALGVAILITVLLAGTFWFTPATVHVILMLLLAGGFLAGGLRTVIELQAHHKQGDRENSDVAMLAHSIRPMEWIIFVSYWLTYLVLASLIAYTSSDLSSGIIAL